MATRLTPADWFRLRVVDFARLDEAAGLLDDFARHAIDAVLIRQVYPADYMHEISRRVEAHEPPFYVFPPVSASGEARGYRHLYGITLVAARPDLAEYFRVAKSFRDDCRQLFGDGEDFEGRVRHIFSKLSGGRPVTLAETPDGQIYMPATVRILPEGSTIDLHCDNNLGHYPTYGHLKTLCDVNDQLSYFLTVNTPDDGGELVFYQRRWSADDDAPSRYEMHKDAAMVEGCASFSLKPEPGDLILHAGGRLYHRVSASVGPRTRHTIGGFVANAFDGDTLYYWS